MPNQQHLDLLRQGQVDNWNSWRQSHPEESPDLSDADLPDITLTGYN
jgi:proteasome lid subunit RPN8/RPN11